MSDLKKAAIIAVVVIVLGAGFLLAAFLSPRAPRADRIAFHNTLALREAAANVGLLETKEDGAIAFQDSEGGRMDIETENDAYQRVWIRATPHSRTLRFAESLWINAGGPGIIWRGREKKAALIGRFHNGRDMGFWMTREDGLFEVTLFRVDEGAKGEQTSAAINARFGLGTHSE